MGARGVRVTLFIIDFHTHPLKISPRACIRDTCFKWGLAIL